MKKRSRVFAAVESVGEAWDRRKFLDKGPAELRIPRNMAILENNIYDMSICWHTHCISHFAN